MQILSLGQEDPLESQLEKKGGRSLLGYSPWARKELNMMEHTEKIIYMELHSV